MAVNHAPTPTWHVRSHGSLFVRAIHLLDLDLLPDFPSITLASFTARPQSQSAGRVKAVEWSLYRLFQRYDAKECQSKLAPFFPANSPLLSKNLRAAQYKWLTELKTSGVLGKEIVLRKTMLDECKGDKFDELLAAFAMLVLRSVVERRDTGARRPVTGRSTTTTTATTTTTTTKRPDPEHVVPLIIAHRVSLSRNLERRKTLRDEATRSLAQADHFKHDLALRADAARETIEPLPADELAQLHDTIERTLPSNRRLARFLLAGNNPHASSAQTPLYPFSTATSTTKTSTNTTGTATTTTPSSTVSPGASAEPGPAITDPSIEMGQQLQRMSARQSIRARQLQGTRDAVVPPDRRVPGTRHAETAASAPSGGATAPRFTLHRALSLTATLPPTLDGDSPRTGGLAGRLIG